MIEKKKEEEKEKAERALREKRRKEEKSEGCGMEVCECSASKSDSSTSLSSLKSDQSVKEKKKSKKNKKEEDQVKGEIAVKIFYGSQTGTTKKLANNLSAALSSKGVATQISDFTNYEAEDFPNEKSYCVFILSTYEGGGPTINSKWFYEWLNFSATDFRYI